VIAPGVPDRKPIARTSGSGHAARRKDCGASATGRLQPSTAACGGVGPWLPRPAVLPAAQPAVLRGAPGRRGW